MTTTAVRKKAKSARSNEPGRGGSAVLFIPLVALLMFGVLAMGSVDPGPMAILELGASALLVLWAAMQTVRGHLELPHIRACWPAVVFVSVVLMQVALKRTAYLAVTRERAALVVCYLGIFLVTPLAARSGAYLQRVAAIWATFGGLVALLGIVQFFTSRRMIYWKIQPQSGGDAVFGPYVNHNHYAGMVELVLPLALVLALGEFVPREKRLFAAGIAGLMAVSVFLSGSRGGMIAIIIELVAFAVLLQLDRDHDSNGVFKYVIGCAMLVALLAWLADQEVISRILSVKNSLEPGVNGHRLAIARDSWRIVKDHLFFGSGLGTFAIVYRGYRTFYWEFLVNEAHNDFIQALVETGVIGFAAVLWFLVVLFRTAFASVRTWRCYASQAVRVAAGVSAIGLAVHSFTDFNLQIPGNAALFAMIAAIACTPSETTVQARKSMPSVIMMP